MSTTGQKLRELREKAGLTLRKAAMQADIDVAILSKMERGERKLTKELILKLAKMYNENPEKLIIDFLSEKVIHELKNEEFGLQALKVAEKQIKYMRTNNK
ncbi:MAG: helix-turn-helix domain-containing protein [Bacteroidales bacterium]